MRQYIRYELQARKWSANVIMGIYEYTDENGKTKEKSDMVLAPMLNKADGDVYADLILNYLNQPIDDGILYAGKKQYKNTVTWTSPAIDFGIWISTNNYVVCANGSWMANGTGLYNIVAKDTTELYKIFEEDTNGKTE